MHCRGHSLVSFSRMFHERVLCRVEAIVQYLSPECSAERVLCSVEVIVWYLSPECSAERVLCRVEVIVWYLSPECTAERVLCRVEVIVWYLPPECSMREQYSVWRSTSGIFLQNVPLKVLCSVEVIVWYLSPECSARSVEVTVWDLSQECSLRGRVTDPDPDIFLGSGCCLNIRIRSVSEFSLRVGSGSGFSHGFGSFFFEIDSFKS